MSRKKKSLVDKIVYHLTKKPEGYKKVKNPPKTAAQKLLRLRDARQQQYNDWYERNVLSEKKRKRKGKGENVKKESTKPKIKIREALKGGRKSPRKKPTVKEKNKSRQIKLLESKDRAVKQLPRFNGAKSKSVKFVMTGKVSNDAHSVPISAEPNSVHISNSNGKVYSERYFDQKGKPYLDIDYSDHGNPKMHPVVPHEHTITEKDGKFFRDKKWREIQK